MARAPAPLAGLLEVAGLGLLRLPYLAEIRPILLVDLGSPATRLPEPERDDLLGLPRLRLDSTAASAAQRLALGVRLPSGPRRSHRRCLRRMTGRRIVVVTGLSGAGKSSILHAMEDLGYETIDNPPVSLLDELLSQTDRPLAIGVDARTRGFAAEAILEALDRLRSRPELAPELVFASAEDPVLLRRYTETRAAAPSGARRPNPGRHCRRATPHRGAAGRGRSGTGYLGPCTADAAPDHRRTLRAQCLRGVGAHPDVLRLSWRTAGGGRYGVRRPLPAAIHTMTQRCVLILVLSPPSAHI